MTRLVPQCTPGDRSFNIVQGVPEFVEQLNDPTIIIVSHLKKILAGFLVYRMYGSHLSPKFCSTQY